MSLKAHRETPINSMPTLESLTFPTHKEQSTHVSIPSLGVRAPTEK